MAAGGGLGVARTLAVVLHFAAPAAGARGTAGAMAGVRVRALRELIGVCVCVCVCVSAACTRERNRRLFTRLH